VGLERLRHDSPSEDRGAIMTTLKTTVGVVSAMSERGMYSQQNYQGLVNHRPMSYKSILYKTTKDGPPLLQSLVKPEPNENFDRILPVSMFFTEIVEVANEPDKELCVRSPCKLHVQIGDNEYFKFGYLKNREIRSLGGSCFKRALEFFNLKWVNEEGEEIDSETKPDLSDLVNFLSIFSDHAFETIAGFKEFLDKHQFGKLYVYDDTIDLQGNYRRFFDLYRAFVNLRPNAVDGRHRSCVMSSFCTGFYDLKDKAPLKWSETERSPFHENYATWQVYNKMQMKVATIADSNSFADTVTLLRLVGDDDRRAQNLSIPVTWSHMICNIATKIYDEEEITELNYDNFWRVEKKTTNPTNTLYHNLSAAWLHISSSIDDDTEYQNLVSASISADWKGAKVKAEERFNDIRYLPALKKIPKPLMVMLQLIKVCSHSKEDLESLGSIFGTITVEFPQRTPDSELPWGILMDYRWMRHFVMDVAEDLIEDLLKDRLMMEYKLLTELRGDKDKIYDAGRTHMNWSGAEFKNIIPEGKPESNTWHLGTCSLVFNKCCTALHRNFVMSVIRAILKFGVDPVIPDTGGKNASLREYLR